MSRNVNENVTKYRTMVALHSGDWNGLWVSVC